MRRRFAVSLILLVSAGLVLVGARPAAAKEYNQPQGMGHEQQAKISRTLADAKRLQAQGGNTPGVGGVTNVGCGGLSIGNVEEIRTGQRVDRDIIITGDVINIASGCNQRRGN